MKAFYNKLIDTLTSPEAIEKFTTNNVWAIVMVDLYRGQYLYEDSFEMLILPAVLLEYNIDYENHEAVISLHLCYEQVYETNNLSLAKDNALMFFDFVDTVYDLVYKMESTHTGKLKLLSEGQQRDDTPTNVHLLTFKCSYRGKRKKHSDEYILTEGNEVETVGTIVKDFNL